MFSFHYLQDAPILDTGRFPELGGNINGPALIRAPGWIASPPARYLLYFAHHLGRSIRLATSNRLAGPWRLHDPPPLVLEDSRFATGMTANSGRNGDDYPHIASPEIWVDDDRRQLRLYYHGRMQDGSQQTRVAISADGLHFTASGDPLTGPYLRVFRDRGWFYGLCMPARLSRSRDGLGGFETGPRLTDEAIRHHALLHLGHCWYVFWTRVGDRPERILVSRLDTRGDWRRWRFADTAELHRATRAWEGADLPSAASEYGVVMDPVNQLRDPAIYCEDGRIYLLYAIAGEQGIAIGEIIPDPAACD